MKYILLGQDVSTNRDVRIPRRAFDTHFHLIGGTGKGKTTAIHTILRWLLRDPLHKACFFIIDRMGNFSQELLLWMASSEFCTEDVRRRLVLIRPSREDVVLPFNPLLYDSLAHGYYKVERATEIVLRAWESVNIEAMPRLARWTFNAFWAAAQLGLTIADCVHFLMPGSSHHSALLSSLPPRLQAEWVDITQARSKEATQILDSSRNRLKPYFESDILRRMFGSAQSNLNVEQFMREGKIVIIDLAPRNRIALRLANTIGSLILNEVIATARNLPRGVRYPTYVLLDEFQNFVGPDIESALPEVRQLGLKLLLSHQSFSQLKRGDYDLTSMIFQAQSRMIFGLQGEDADILAHELASLTFDPYRIKDEIHSRRQLVTGQTILELSSWSEANANSEQWRKDYGSSTSSNENYTYRTDQHDDRTRGRGNASQISRREGKAGGVTSTLTHGTHQILKPEYEEFLELSNRTYASFQEQRSEWARDVRKLPTGQTLMRLVDNPQLYHVRVKRSVPGYLKYDFDILQQRFPQVVEAMDRLVEENFQSDMFLPAHVIDRQAERRIQDVLHPRIILQTRHDSENESQSDNTESDTERFI
jgi:hypothetical protein